MSKIRFQSFSSGSCGNCYFIGIEEEKGSIAAGLLIDAGVGPRSLKKHLAASGLGTEHIDAILLTHDHMDHVRSLGTLCKYLRKPVWTTEVLHGALSRSPFYRNWYAPWGKVLAPGWNDFCGGRIRVHWFELPHDATQTVGYAILLDGFRFVLMTDLGRMTQQALSFCYQADAVVIESNYDREMLAHGPYPEDLKRRISQGHGHLSNDECAEAIRAFDHDGLRSVFLCHLSDHNNTPELAFSTSRPSLSPDKRLVPLPRQVPSPLFEL